MPSRSQCFSVFDDFAVAGLFRLRCLFAWSAVLHALMAGCYASYPPHTGSVFVSREMFPAALGCDKVGNVSHRLRRGDTTTRQLQIISDLTRAEGGNAVEKLEYDGGELTGSAMHCPVGTEFAEHGVTGTRFFPVRVPEAPMR